jgi:hypothetical protein
MNDKDAAEIVEAERDVIRTAIALTEAYEADGAVNCDVALANLFLAVEIIKVAGRE